jgi:hypothetical protein
VPGKNQAEPTTNIGRAIAKAKAPTQMFDLISISFIGKGLQKCLLF